MKKHVSVIDMSSMKRRNVIRTGLLITLFLSICVIVVTIYGQNVGNFVITVEQESSELGLALSEDPNFEIGSVRLYADPISNTTNISGFDIPKNIVEGDGGKNGPDGTYLAYSFYLKNTGNVKMSYSAKINIVEEYLNVSSAFRLWVIKETEGNVTSDIYAHTPSEDGFSEMELKFPNSINIPLQTFDGNVVFDVTNAGFEVGQVARYTIVLWLEGDDPDCQNDILGGFIRFQMQFECLYSEEDKKD